MGTLAMHILGWPFRLFFMDFSAFQNAKNLEEHTHLVNAELNEKEETVSQDDIWNVLYHRKNGINANWV